MSSISSLTSSQQSVVFKALMAKSDANKDGNVSEDEMSSSISKIQKTLGNDKINAKDLFKTMDADENGSVSKDEYASTLSSMVNAGAKDKTGETDAATARSELIASVQKGLKASMTSTLLGTKDTSSSHASMSDLFSLLGKQQGSTSTTYSAAGSSSARASAGALFNARA